MSMKDQRLRPEEAGEDREGRLAHNMSEVRKRGTATRLTAFASHKWRFRRKARLHVYSMIFVVYQHFYQLTMGLCNIQFVHKVLLDKDKLRWRRIVLFIYYSSTITGYCRVHVHCTSIVPQPTHGIQTTAGKSCAYNTLLILLNKNCLRMHKPM